MAPRKSERIMNLTISLLMARRFLPREHLREVVAVSYTHLTLPTSDLV